MDHPNIVPVREWVIVHNTVFILMEYVQSGEYFDRIILTKNITDKSVAIVIK
jgi:serine/threonine protein kinase